MLGVLLGLALIGAAVYLVFQPDFLGYYFAGPGGEGHWYLRAVWGNVWAAVPCSVLAVLWARAKLAAHRKAQHEEHLERMAQADSYQQEQREHNMHMWAHTAELYERTTGKHARMHPHDPERFGKRN